MERLPFRRPAMIEVSLIAGIIVLCVGVYFFYLLNKPSPAFPEETALVIDEGMPLTAIATLLEEQHYVNSSLFTLLLLKTIYHGSFVQAESYTFHTPPTTSALLHAITTGTSLTPSERVRFPEGFRVEQMTEFLPERFASENLNPYILYEGYLFPDTYEIARDDTLENIVERMNQAYGEKTEHLQAEMDNSILSEEAIITFASLVQREANTVQSMRTVAGILWKRLAIGMPLQVDATFHYLLGKASSELTREDLAIDSPYNTYANVGLPPGPIANPGLDAIEAVLDPIESEYLFYLTGNDGNFYYAKTFEEHQANIARYLR